MIPEEELERVRSLVALAMNGHVFAQYASSQLLMGAWLLKGLSFSLCWELLVSAATRKDKQAMLRFLSDWTGKDYLNPGVSCGTTSAS